MDTNKEKPNLWKKFRITENLVNSLLILILGFLIGVAVKTEAKKRITIGYDDYTASQMKQGFNLMEKTPAPAQSVNDSGDSQQPPTNGDVQTQPESTGEVPTPVAQ
ncbi:MAG: hypothetical protein WC858_01365 [Parcubacteria group bacterium]|jgi:hypothetical protein